VSGSLGKKIPVEKKSASGSNVEGIVSKLLICRANIVFSFVAPGSDLIKFLFGLPFAKLCLAVAADVDVAAVAADDVVDIVVVVVVAAAVVENVAVLAVFSRQVYQDTCVRNVFSCVQKRKSLFVLSQESLF
jgi:hypothetical protein